MSNISKFFHAEEKRENEISYTDYIPTIQNIDILKSSNKKLDTDKYIFAKKINTHDFIVLKPNQLNFLRQNNHLYEIVNYHGFTWLYMDLDNLINLSYNDIIKLTNDFKEFLRTEHNITHKIECNIHISTNESKTKTYSLDETGYISSVHIIFNVLLFNVNSMKQLMKQFIGTNKKLTDYIDLNVYSFNKKFRTLFQSKEKIGDKEPSGKILLKYEYKNGFACWNSTITENDLCSYIVNHNLPIEQIDGKEINTKDKKYYLQIEIENKTIELKHSFNTFYSIDEIEHAKKYIKNLSIDKFINKQSWKNLLRFCVFYTIIYGVEWSHILEHELIQLFLKKSLVGKYNTSEYQQKNIDYIKEIINKKELKTHYQKNKFDVLNEKELTIIYNKIQKQPNEPILIQLIDINKKTFFKISYGNTIEILKENMIIYTNSKISKKIVNTIIKTKNDYMKPNIKLCETNKSILYNQRQQILLMDYEIHDNKLYANQQYHIALEEIFMTECSKNIKTQEKCIYTINEISNLEQLKPTDENTYINAPVGSGKSYILENDILHIINQNDKNKCVVIADTITMASKLHMDILNIYIKNGLDTDEILFYQDMKQHIYIADNIRIFIVCYESLKNIKHKYKPTHLIMDEFVNITKKFTENCLKINRQKNETVEFLFDLFKTCVIKAYDANIEHHILQFFKHLKINIKIFKLIDYVQYNNNVIYLEHRNQLNTMLNFLNQNKKISISASSVKECYEIETTIQNAIPNIKMIVITARGANESFNENPISKKLKKDIAKNTNMLCEYDVVIYSPCIQTGISFNIENYFYCHFHFIQPSTCSATQNSQMIFRIRKTESKTIYITVIKNNSNTFKNLKINDITNAKISNHTDFIDNQTNNEYSLFWNKKQTNSNTTVCKNDNILKLDFVKYSILENLDLLQEHYLMLKYYTLVFDIFRNVYNYGCNNIHIKFYPTLMDINKTSTTEFIEQTEQACVSIEKIKQSFKKAMFIDVNTNDKRKNEDEIDYTIEKSFNLLRYNQSVPLWNHYNINTGEDNASDDDVGDDEVGNHDAGDDFNKIDELFNIYDNAMGGDGIFDHYNKFKRLSYVAYYEVKHMIYSIYEHAFKDNTDFVKLKNNKHYHKNIYCMFGCYVVFKVFDILEINRETIEEMYYNVVSSNKIKFGLCFNIKKHFNKLLELSINPAILNVFNYIQSTTEDGVKVYDLPKNNLHKSMFKFAFDCLELDIELGTCGRIDRGTTGIIRLKNDMFHYRMEKYRYMDCIESSNHENEDMAYWVNFDKKNINEYPVYALPKIRIYKQYGVEITDENKDKIQPYACSNNLLFIIKSFCKENQDELIIKLDETNESINNTEKINYNYCYEISSGNLQFFEKANECNITEVKDVKVKIDRNENIICECGKSYIRTHKARHDKTAFHIKFMGSL